MNITYLKSISAIVAITFTISLSAQRNVLGTPPSDYWQNAANYQLEVELDDQSHTITGRAEIEYTNNSPHILTYLWFHLDQNAFKTNSEATLSGQSDRRFSNSITDGMNIISVKNEKKDLTARTSIEGTKMQVRLREGIPANGGILKLKIEFEYTIPEKGSDRTGRGAIGEDYVYSIAQWYPRVAVFDDLRGWNLLPYRGTGEFYCEFGNFDYKITLPSDYIVAGSGELQNRKKMFRRKFNKRFNRIKADEISNIITEEDFADRIIGTKKKKATWHFKLDNTRDVAWAASKRFLIDGTIAKVGEKKEVLCLNYYLPGLDIAWKTGVKHLKTSIEFYSNTWYGYKYNTMTMVASTEGGIEYPTFTFVPYNRKGNALWTTTDHEVAHNWFPMMIGTNERRHFWLDEGLVTFMGYYAAQEVPYASYMTNIKAMSNRIAKVNTCKSITIPDDYHCDGFYDAMYFKPALGYIILREVILDEAPFDRAFKSFMRKWAFKHPTHEDMFQHFNSVAGKDLTWFWEDWYNSEKKLDQGIVDVQQVNDTIAIKMTNKLDLKMPMVITFTFEDETTIEQMLPAEVWSKGDEFTYHYVTNKAGIKKVEIDKMGMFPDVNRRNNVFRIE
jgi:hypothetical protein